MKKLILAIIITGAFAILIASSCTTEQPSPTPAGTPDETPVETPDQPVMVSSCISCHSDKDILKEVASPEPTGTTSEATSGEG